MFPEWLDYSMLENSAFAKRRGIPGYPIGWSELISSAQTVMSFMQDLEQSKHQELYDDNYAAPLISAARIMDYSSQLVKEFPDSHRFNQTMVAAVAYSMLGNFPSASVCLARVESSAEFNFVSAALLATVAPGLIPKILSKAEMQPLTAAYLEQLVLFLETGNLELTEGLRQKFVDCMLHECTAFESGLMRSARVSLEHIISLSIPAVLEPYKQRFPSDFIHRLTASGLKVLLPPQLLAIQKFELLRGDKDVVLNLPTSTGKTLLGELFLINALDQKPGIVCYIAPYVAIVRQVADSMKRHSPKAFRVIRMTGSYKDAGKLAPDIESTIVVATPERFDAMLRTRPDLVSHIRAVVFDEAHLLESGSRGIRLEGLITRLKMIQKGNSILRLMLMSGVISNGEQLQEWLGTPKTTLIVNDWKPTSRRTAIWTRSGLTWYVGTDKVRRTNQRSDTPYGSANWPWPNNMFYSVKHYGQKVAQQPSFHQNIAYLVNVLQNEFAGPVLAVCGSRSSARGLSRTVADRFSKHADKIGPIGDLILLLQNKYPHLRTLAYCLEKRIAYHVATLPSEVKELIEDAVKSHQIDFVASTTTLAEGVDLPFRFTFIVDWLTWGGSKEKPMAGSLFKNIAGRCGRAGSLTEGDTVIIDNPLCAAPFDSYEARCQLFSKLYLSDELPAMKSSMGVFELDESIAASLASQFIAAIPENPTTENLAQVFFENTLIKYENDEPEKVQKLFSNIVDFIAGDQQEPFAVASSPLKLTQLGMASNNTGFSPRSCREIVNFLRAETIPTDLALAAEQLLSTFFELPEQSNSDLRKVFNGTNNRFCVKSNDIETLLKQWIGGMRTENMFALLPFSKRSKRAQPITNWIIGVDADSSHWDAEFDNFADLVSGVFQTFLPWLLRACDFLAVVAPDQEARPWRNWANYMEFGVNSIWAVEALKLSIPADRLIALEMAESWPVDLVSEADPLGLNYWSANNSQAALTEFFRSIEASGKIDTKNLRAIQTWYTSLL